MNIITIIIACISIVSLALGIYNAWVDKPRLKIRTSKGLEVFGHNNFRQLKNLEPGKMFWSLLIANKGKRRIIIDQVGVKWNHKRGSAIIASDYSGPVTRFELLAYDSKTITIDEALIPSERVKNIYVRDATGKIYKKRFN